MDYEHTKTPGDVIPGMAPKEIWNSQMEIWHIFLHKC